jgi:hypothetical protein
MILKILSEKQYTQFNQYLNIDIAQYNPMIIRDLCVLKFWDLI